jgi:hypothetical protein
MLAYNMLNSSNIIHLYHYKRDDNFRKIKPDVEKIFKEKGFINIKFDFMEKFADLPSWIKSAS